jgi:hypothetical protein
MHVESAQAQDPCSFEVVVCESGRQYTRHVRQAVQHVLPMAPAAR